MQVSQKLQNQIRHYCQQVKDVEWSGVLFYTAEGEFGKENFKCTLHEMYLMDIGTPGYTEYEYGPEFIKYIMENPRLKSMVKGHIHSHNNMKVFFSGTDEEELYGNSGFHNIYLSMIVNNHNDMVANIAFRAEQKSLLIEFKSEKGKVETKTIEDLTTFIFVYECDISLPEVGKLSVEEKRIKELKEKGPHGGKGRQGSFQEDNEEVKSQLKGSNVPKSLYSFVTGLLDRNRHTVRKMKDILQDLNNDLETQGSIRMKNFYRKLQSEIQGNYRMAFPEDASLKKFFNTLKSSVQMLGNYREEFPDLVDDLQNYIKQVYDYDYNDSEIGGRGNYYP